MRSPSPSGPLNPKPVALLMLFNQNSDVFLSVCLLNNIDLTDCCQHKRIDGGPECLESKRICYFHTIFTHFGGHFLIFLVLQISLYFKLVLKICYSTGVNYTNNFSNIE